MSITKKRLAISVFILMLACMVTGCDKSGAETTLSEKEPEISYSVSLESEKTVVVSEKKPLLVEEPGTGDCNHRYNYGGSYWEDPYLSCTKCGYSPARQADYDCDVQGHIIINGNPICSVCENYINYYSDAPTIAIIDYKPATAECDGIVQANNSEDNNILLYLIPAGHNHSKSVPRSINDFGTYALIYEAGDLCLEGQYGLKTCSYCHEALGERILYSEPLGYHLSPVVLDEVDPDNLNKPIHMHCSACGSDYEIMPPRRLTLSGNKSDVMTTTEYCYIDGDDYLIMIDKDIKLPGDFELMISDSIDKIRELTGLTSDSWEFQSDTVGSSMATYTGENVWAFLPDKNRILVNVVVDREAVGYISWAVESSYVLVIYEMFGDDLWNSVPDYRDNPWRRKEEIDYGTVFHEMAHAISLRTISSFKMGNIFTEGLASYIAKKVDEAYIEEGRKDYTPSFDVTYDQTDLDVTPENAEDLFRNDYHNLSHADRGAEYDYGKYFCEYLDTTFGPDYFVRVVNTLNKVEWSADYWGTPTEEDRNNRTEAIKQEFGEDIFVQFGKWFQKHQ